MMTSTRQNYTGSGLKGNPLTPDGAALSGAPDLSRSAEARLCLSENRIEEALHLYAAILIEHPEDIDAYLAIGDCYLTEGDGETAALFYNQALDIRRALPNPPVEGPDDPDMIGRSPALACDDAKEASWSPSRGSLPAPTNIPPSHSAIRNRLWLAELERQRGKPARPIASGPTENPQTPPQAPSMEAVPTQPTDVAGLLQAITRRTTPITEAEVQQAAEMLETIIHSPHPAQSVHENLAAIDSLLPALLELNIRQARADGRADLAKALQELLNHIRLQLDFSATVAEGEAAGHDPAVGSMPGAFPSTTHHPHPTAHCSPSKPAGTFPAGTRVHILAPVTGEASPRQVQAVEALTALGFDVSVGNEDTCEQIASLHSDRNSLIVLAHRPHNHPRLMEALASCSAAKIPLVVDLELDYEQMPLDHDAYESVGLGSAARAKAYATALLLADRISVPGVALGNTLHPLGYSVRIIPDGWSKKNDLWTKPAPPRHTLNLGWIGAPGQLADVAQVRRAVVRLLREFQQTRLIIAGDARVYQLFDNIPEARRIYLPMVSPLDYPYLLAQIDLLIAPYRHNPFNQTLSDRPLMEAGIRGIPWVASPLPDFTTWKAGGLIANTIDEWHTALRQLVLEPDLRAALGQAGRQKAMMRAIEPQAHIGRAWIKLLGDLVTTPGPHPNQARPSNRPSAFTNP